MRYWRFGPHKMDVIVSVTVWFCENTLNIIFLIIYTWISSQLTTFYFKFTLLWVEWKVQQHHWTVGFHDVPVKQKFIFLSFKFLNILWKQVWKKLYAMENSTFGHNWVWSKVRNQKLEIFFVFLISTDRSLNVTSPFSVIRINVFCARSTLCADELLSLRKNRSGVQILFLYSAPSCIFQNFFF